MKVITTLELDNLFNNHFINTDFKSILKLSLSTIGLSKQISVIPVQLTYTEVLKVLKLVDDISFTNTVLGIINRTLTEGLNLTKLALEPLSPVADINGMLNNAETILTKSLHLNKHDPRNPTEVVKMDLSLITSVFDDKQQLDKRFLSRLRLELLDAFCILNNVSASDEIKYNIINRLINLLWVSPVHNYEPNDTNRLISITELENTLQTTAIDIVTRLRKHGSVIRPDFKLTHEQCEYIVMHLANDDNTLTIWSDIYNKYILNKYNGRGYMIDDNSTYVADKSKITLLDNYGLDAIDVTKDIMIGFRNDNDNIRPYFDKMYAFTNLLHRVNHTYNDRVNMIITTWESICK